MEETVKELVRQALQAAQAFAEANYREIDERVRPILVASYATDWLRQQGIARARAQRLVRRAYPEWENAERFVEERDRMATYG